MESVEIIINAFRKYSTSRNYRKSTMRETVLLQLWNCAIPKDADTLFTEIRSRGENVKLGNVYNALRWLTNEGFLLKTFIDKRSEYCIHKQKCSQMIKLSESL